MLKKRVLAGMRPSNKLHVGNLFGSAKGMITLQENKEYETLYMVADLHALTTPYEKKELSKNTKEVVLDYLSAGLDPEKSIIFVQSHITEHIELSYLFSTVMSLARMTHLPTYKEKVKQYPNHSTVALLHYPILMAADILVYKASLVPVGIDQEPHMEISREIARKMNSLYDTSFPEPQRFKTEGEYVPSLTGVGKMSKSVEGSYISLTDDLETIKKKLASAPTDSGKGTIKNISKTKEFTAGMLYVNEEGIESKGVDALLRLVELFDGVERREQYDKQYISGGIKYGELKSKLAEVIFEELKPIQEKRKELESRPQYLDEVLESGARKARKIARETVKEVKEKMGLI